MASNRDKSAFEKIMNYYLDIIYNYILVHVKSQEDVKDIVQETMISIWRSIKDFNGKSSFKTWVISITRRRIVDFYRKLYKDLKVQDNINNTITGCEENYCETDIEMLTEKLVIRNAVNNLSDAEREIVYLVFNAQLSYKEIEQITGIPCGTIKSRMSAVRKKLRLVLVDESAYDGGEVAYGKGL